MFNPRGKQPPFGSTLNPSHTLVRGLWSAHYFLEDGSYAAFDSSLNNRHATVGGGTLTQRMRNGLRGRQTSGSTGYVALSAGHMMTEFTHAVVWTYPESYAGTEQAISTIAETPGSSTRDRSIYIRSGGLPSFYIYDGLLQHANGPAVIEVGTTYVIVGIATTTTLTCYVNGVQGDNLTGIAAAFTGYASPELVIGYGSGNTSSIGSNGIFHAHLVWNRALSGDDVRAFTRDPFALLVHRPMQRYLVVAAASGAPATPAAWLPRRVSFAQAANLRR